ncbi:MAG: hydantoin utilization protein B [Rhizobiales bacterium]|nr:hydantoin utilization protein B [Hyphomicrobiales bacterium]
MAIDKVTLQILANHCSAAAESMANTLLRTAHSTFVKETEDFTTGLATPDGKTFASPYELGVTWFVGLDYGRAIRHIDRYEPGDIAITNDPYSGFVCTHSPDTHLWKPIFHKGELVCFSVTHIHNTDVGGAVPASLSRTLTEVHQEGIRIPPVKIYKKGELNREIRDTMLANVRMPEQNWGDMKAQVAAVNTGERKVHEMIARFGFETFIEGRAALLDHGEAQARRVIAAIPDGEYFFADYTDEDSVGGYPCRIALNLVVKGDELLFDFSQSDPQLTSSLNIPSGGDPRHALLMIAYVYLVRLLDPKILLNSGVLRPCDSVLPKGSMVNPEFPAAVGMRTLTTLRLQSVLLGAFAKALPGRIPAACGDGGPLLNIRTTDNRTGRKIMANLNPISGGGGGTSFRDGTEGSGANFGFLKNTPVEISEAEVPVKILGYGLATDSGGAGKYRGGLGTELEFEVQSPHSFVTARNRDRTHFAPWGLEGGRHGRTSAFWLNRGSNREVNLGNTDIFTAEPGDRVYICSAGAGGWGSPWERDTTRVLDDVERGFVSQEAAERLYGVVIREGAIDRPATERARAAMAARDAKAFYGFNQHRIDFEKVWSLDAYAELIRIVSGLPVHWRFFVKHKVFEAVGQLPADQRGGGSAQVREIFERLCEEFPQLARSRLAAAE